MTNMEWKAIVIELRTNLARVNGVSLSRIEDKKMAQLITMWADHGSDLESHYGLAVIDGALGPEIEQHTRKVAITSAGRVLAKLGREQLLSLAERLRNNPEDLSSQ